MTLTAPQKEKIWLDSCSTFEFPTPADSGEPDRYVALGAEFYTALAVVEHVDRNQIVDLAIADAIKIIQAEATENSAPQLLADEHWCLAALGAALEASAQIRSGVQNG